MQAKLQMTQIWAENELVELRLDVCDGISSFTNQIYVQRSNLLTAALGLEKSMNHANGRYDLSFGNSGPEYGAGALQAHVHYSSGGRVKVKICAQSEFFLFDEQAVASEATLSCELE